MVYSLAPSAIFLETKVLAVPIRMSDLALPELSSMSHSLSLSTARLEELSPSSFERMGYLENKVSERTARPVMPKLCQEVAKTLACVLNLFFTIKIHRVGSFS